MASKGVSIGVQITGDAKGFKAASEDAIKATEKLTSAANNSKRGFSNFSKEMITVNQTLGSISQAIDIAVKAFELYGEVMKSTGATGDDFEFSMQGVNDQLLLIKTSLATMDFEGFISNLRRAFIEGQRYAGVLDELDDETRALNYAEADAIKVLSNLNFKSASYVKGSKEQIQISKDIISQEEKLAVIRLGIASRAYQNELTHITERANSIGEGNLVTEEQIDLFTRLDTAFMTANAGALRYNEAVKQQSVLYNKTKTATGQYIPFTKEQALQYNKLTKEISNTDQETRDLAETLKRLSIPTDQEYTKVVEAYTAQEQARASAMDKTTAAKRRQTAAESNVTKTNEALIPLINTFKDVDEPWSKRMTAAEEYYNKLPKIQQETARKIIDQIKSETQEHIDNWRGRGTTFLSLSSAVGRTEALRILEDDKKLYANRAQLFDLLVKPSIESQQKWELEQETISVEEKIKKHKEYADLWLTIQEDINKEVRLEIDKQYERDLNQLEAQYISKLITEKSYLDQKLKLNQTYLIATGDTDSGKGGLLSAQHDLDVFNDKFKGTIELVDGLQSAFESMFTSISSGSDDAFNDMAKAFSRAMLQMAAQMAAKAVIFSVLLALTGGTGALANNLGIKAGGLGKFLGFADGGIVSGPTLANIGEYAGAKSNPEVVAPLSKLKDLIGGNPTNITVNGVIKGKDLALVLSRYNNELQSNT